MHLSRRCLLRRIVPAVLVLALLVLHPSTALAEPWFGWGQNHAEDRYESGDLDAEDLLDGTIVGRSHNGAESVRAGSWLTLGGFWRKLETGTGDLGLLLILGVALDKVAQGSVHDLAGGSIADGTAKWRPPPPVPDPPPLIVSPPPLTALPPPAANTPPPPPLTIEQIRVVVTPGVARRAVAAAWRTSGLGVDDARIDSMVAARPRERRAS